MVVGMPTIAAWPKLVEGQEAQGLRDAAEKLDSAEGEVVFDFSGVRRIDSNTLRALGEFARSADEKAVTVVLRNVNVDIYKALTLAKLTSRFSFVS